MNGNSLGWRAVYAIKTGIAQWITMIRVTKASFTAPDTTVRAFCWSRASNVEWVLNKKATTPASFLKHVSVWLWFPTSHRVCSDSLTQFSWTDSALLFPCSSSWPVPRTQSHGDPWRSIKPIWFCVPPLKRFFLPVLFLGDGANDVSMIQVADVGVGISGQEGMQVKASPGILWALTDKAEGLAFNTTDARLLLSQ